MYRVTGENNCSVLVVAVPDMPAFEALLDRLAAYGQPTGEPRARRHRGVARGRATLR